MVRILAWGLIALWTATIAPLPVVAEAVVESSTSGVAEQALPASKRAVQDWTTAMAMFRVEGEDVGAETLWIDHERLAMERVLSRQAGQPVQLHQRIIDDGAWLTVLNIEKSGSAKVVYRAETGGWPLFLEEYHEDWMWLFEQMKAWQLRVDVAADRCGEMECTVYQSTMAGSVERNRWAFHRGLLIQQEGWLDGNVNGQQRHAETVQFDVLIPEDIFVLPAELSKDQRNDRQLGLAQYRIEQTQRVLGGLTDDPVYGPLLSKCRFPPGGFDVLAFRRLLREGRIRPPAIPMPEP